MKALDKNDIKAVTSNNSIGHIVYFHDETNEDCSYDLNIVQIK